MSRFKLTRNTVIILVNIVASNILLFCCCAFFFQNLKLFEHDIKTYMFFCPILLVLGILFVCFYIITLVTHIDTNDRSADRYDLPYKIVFSTTLILLVVRSFLGDFLGYKFDDKFAGTMLNIPYETIGIVIGAIISGIITWVTPKIKDNDNTEF